MRLLLDVNVLVALLDDAHAFSAKVYEWLNAETRRIATCPLVENGVIRVMSSPGYSDTHRASPSRVADALLAMTRALDHEFWPDDVSILDPAAIDIARLHGHRQITDAYLLALAVKHGGALGTLDAAIPTSAVRGAGRKHLAML